MKDQVLKVVGIIITIITLVAGAVVWAATEHSDIKASASDTFLSKESASDKFAPRGDMIRVESRVESLENDLDRMDKKIDNIDGKMDRMLRILGGIHSEERMRGSTP